MTTSALAELVAVLLDARTALAHPGNDFAWSSWENAAEALEELDALVAMLRRTERPSHLHLAVLFAATGPIQEVSLSSGWGDEFPRLAARFDAAVARVYGEP